MTTPIAHAPAAARPAVCCVSTYNQLHAVLALVRSIRRHWAEQPAIVVLLLDHPELARPGFADVADIRFCTPAELDIPDFDWLALKFNAMELACACKSPLVAHVLQQGHELVWYVDADILFFADPAVMRAQAAQHDFVVTPHLFGPFPAREAWVHPTIENIANAGTLNAGIFTARRSDATLRFLQVWAGMSVRPGACLSDASSHHEQQAFNWITTFAESVALCRDRRMNVAYWNLHERPLRWAHLDGGPRDQWLLDGDPICCFHFSGLNGKPGYLSAHDDHHVLGLNINLHHLVAHYNACLDAAGRDHYAPHPYDRAQIGSIPLNDTLRRRIKLLELHTTLRLDFHSEQDATRLMDHLLQVPGHHTLLPAILEEILDQRPDLQAYNQGELLLPKIFLQWCLRHLEPEYSDRLPLFRSSLLAVHRRAHATLVQRCVACLPGVSADWIADALVHARPALLTALQPHAQAASLRAEILDGEYLQVATNPVSALRMMLLRWPELFPGVPALHRETLPLFRDRMRAALDQHVAWPAAHRETLDRLDPDASLARVLAVVRRQPASLTLLRAEGLTRAFLQALLPTFQWHADFDAQDLALVDWVFSPAEPAASPAPTRRQQAVHRLQRLVNRGAPPPNAPAEPGRGNTSAVILPFLADETDPQRWQGYVDWLTARHGIAPAPADLGSQLRTARWDALGGTHPTLAPVPAGLNIFGYFKSPIGLGQMSKGVAAAHHANAHPHREIVVTNMTMAADLRTQDLYPNFAFHFPRNLAITYPHIDHDLHDLFPPSFFRDRETIAYIAWEQRDLHPDWCRRLERYDRLFALSQFTADSVSRATGRPCAALPCVVEMDAARAKAFHRRDFDLPENAFIAGFMFDASSSIERKNPVAAAQALIQAFRGRPDVFVVIKVNNGHRGPFRRSVDAVAAMFTEANIAHRMITAIMPRAEVEGLMAQLDLYISLHRSEGFGYTLAEAMWLGVPVVATAYSGNMDFMTDDNSYLVRFREALVRESEGPFQIGTVWAEPDVAHAAALCDQIYSDRGEARARALRGERGVRAITSVEAIAARLQTLLG